MVKSTSNFLQCIEVGSSMVNQPPIFYSVLKWEAVWLNQPPIFLQCIEVGNSMVKSTSTDNVALSTYEN